MFKKQGSGGRITHRFKMLDSRWAKGFLVHLSSGPLIRMAILLNRAKSCAHHNTLNVHMLISNKPLVLVYSWSTWTRRSIATSLLRTGTT